MSLGPGTPLNANGNLDMYMGFGAGTMTLRTPKNVYDVNEGFLLEGGLEVKALGPFWISVGVNMIYNMGNLSYDYTGSDNVHYTASDIQFISTEYNLQAALQFRLINAKHFKLWAEGGAYIGEMDLATDADTDVHLMLQGSNYLGTQSSIIVQGSFAEAGIDLIPGNVGLRLAGRVSHGSTDKVHFLAEQKLSFVDAYGYFALVRVY